MDDDIRQLLYDECGVRMSDELYERFEGARTEVRLKNKEVLIPYGKFDANMYVLKSGILRMCYLDDESEKTYGFAMPGTITISYYSYYMRRPASFKIESCGESVVMKMPETALDELLRSSHEFALWFTKIQAGQLYSHEYKNSVITGSAKDRFLSLIKNRPDIMLKLPSQTIASYLGVTSTYLSRLKKAYILGKWE